MRNRFTSRRGGVSLLTLFLIGLGLVLAAVAIDLTALWHTQHEMRVSADASTLAAARALVDDRWLSLSRDQRLTVAILKQVHQVADQYVGDNPSMGEGHKLQPNPKNDPDGDLAFGQLTDEGFQPLAGHSLLASQPTAVQVRIVRSRERKNPAGFLLLPLFGLSWADISVRSVALADRHFVAFQARRDHPIPLVPIALLSDPMAQDPQSWEYQTGSQGKDRFAWDEPRMRSGEDGIPEVEVWLPLKTGHSALLNLFGSGDLPRQIENGLTLEHLASAKGRLEIPSAGLMQPTFAPLKQSEWSGVFAALEQLRRKGDARAFVLYRPAGSPTTSVILTKFVAARVVSVSLSEREGERGILVLLQPAQIATSTAVTTRDEPANSAPLHRHIAKVRLVE